MEIKQLQAGQLGYRKGWNGKGMRIFKQIPSECSLSIVPKMTSLPSAVKKYLIDNNITPKYRNQLAIIHPDGTIDSWVPSVSDMFADDWVFEGESEVIKSADGILHSEGITSTTEDLIWLLVPTEFLVEHRVTREKRCFKLCIHMSGDVSWLSSDDNPVTALSTNEMKDSYCIINSSKPTVYDKVMSEVKVVDGPLNISEEVNEESESIFKNK